MFYPIVDAIRMIKKRNEKKNEIDNFSESTSSSVNENENKNKNTVIIIIVIILILCILYVIYNFSNNGKDQESNFFMSIGKLILLVIFPTEFMVYHIGVTSGIEWVLNGKQVKPEGWFKNSLEKSINSFNKNYIIKSPII